MIKRKNIYVIGICAIIAFLVIISSFLGLIIYLQWRQLRIAYNYYDTLEEGDTIAYAQNIEISSLKTSLLFKRHLIVEGKIKNKGKRTIISLALRISFLDSLGKPVFGCMIYPLEPFQSQKAFKKMRFTYFAFLKGPAIGANKTIIFKYYLWQCPKKFIKMLRSNSMSGKPGEWSGSVSAELVNLKLKPG